MQSTSSRHPSPDPGSLTVAGKGERWLYKVSSFLSLCSPPVVDVRLGSYLLFICSHGISPEQEIKSLRGLVTRTEAANSSGALFEGSPRPIPAVLGGALPYSAGRNFPCMTSFNGRIKVAMLGVVRAR